MPAPSSRSLPIPAIRIVSLTITEGGYFIDPASGMFNPTHPDIVADAANIGAPEDGVRHHPCRADAPPRRRHRAVHRHVLRQHSRTMATSPPTASSGLPASSTRIWPSWVSEKVAFPNGMVDRITPATTDRERDLLRSEFGVEDNWPVFCEPFKQWVLEDKFHRRPPGAGKGRRPVREGCLALRADEDPHPQWRPCDHRLSGRADGHPLRPRGDGGAAGPRISSPSWSRKRSSRPCRRCRASCSTITSS